MINGNIQLHRQLLISDVWQLKPEAFKIFILILLKVNFKPHKFVFNSDIIDLKAGQHVTSVEKLTKYAGNNITTRQVRTALKQLVKLNILTIETTNRFTLITVVNWAKYQTASKQVPNKTPNKRQTNDKQTPNKRQTNANKYIRTIKENNENHENQFIKAAINKNSFLSSVTEELLTNEQKEERYKSIALELKNSTAWHESVAIALNKSPEEIKTLIIEFLKILKADGQYFKQFKEIQSHFRNWAKRNGNQAPTKKEYFQNQNIPLS